MRKILYLIAIVVSFLSSLINVVACFCNRHEDPIMAMTQLGSATLCFTFGCFYCAWFKNAIPTKEGK